MPAALDPFLFTVYLSDNWCAYEHISSYPPPLAVRGAGLSRLPPAFGELLAALLPVLAAVLLLPTLGFLDGGEGARRTRFREAPTFRSRETLPTLVMRDGLPTGALGSLSNVVDGRLRMAVPHVGVSKLLLATLFSVRFVLGVDALHRAERVLRPERLERGEPGALVTELATEDLLPRERGREVNARATDGTVQPSEVRDEPGALLEVSRALRPGTLGANLNGGDDDGSHGNGGHFGSHTLSLFTSFFKGFWRDA